MSVLLICGAVNLFYNVYPDYVKVDSLKSFYSDVADELLSQGIDCVLVDQLSHPTVAACSDDKISCFTFVPDFDVDKEGGALFKSVEFLRPDDVIRNLNPARSAILISEYNMPYMTSFVDQLADSASDDYLQLFNSHLTLKSVYDHELTSIYVYTFDTADIIS